MWWARARIILPWERLQVPLLRPWEWPEHIPGAKVDGRAQASAYGGLLSGMLTTRELLGGFVWRLYADPDDLSQEAEWGFSPRGRQAELFLRDAFWGSWASDRADVGRGGLFRPRAEVPGVF